VTRKTRELKEVIKLVDSRFALGHEKKNIFLNRMNNVAKRVAAMGNTRSSLKNNRRQQIHENSRRKPTEAQLPGGSSFSSLAKKMRERHNRMRN